MTTAGQEAAEIARRAGTVLDSWQLYGLDAILGQDAEGDWAASETGTVAGRQTGKNGLIEPVELYGLFVLGEQILHTAHRLDASRGSHARLWRQICADPVLRRQVEQRRTANEEQSILLDTGAKIEFTVRSDEGARSKTYDRVVMDEGFAATDGHIGAILPTLVSKSNWQINWLSSAGMARSLALHALRARAVAGEAGLTYLEWSADPARYSESPERARRDRALLRQSLPALGGRLTFDTVQKLAASMPPDQFDREILGIWDEPAIVEKWSVIGQEQWNAAADHSSVPLDPVAFAIDVTPDRSRTAIGMAAWREDRRRTVEVIDDRPGTSWAVQRLGQLVRQWKPVVVALDDSGPAGALIEGLRDEGIDVTTTTSRQMAQACGRFVDGVVDDAVKHRDDKRLNDAVESAGKRKLADAFAFDRRGEAYIHTLVAVTLADWALAARGRPVTPPAKPQAVPSDGDGAAGATDDLTRIGF